MCRLFGLLGTETTPAEPWLVTTDRSLFAQSNVTPATSQPDGWGIAWYPGGGPPRVEKGIHGASEDRDAFDAAARAARGPVVLGHLRKASNPMRLPRRRLIGLENSQPFLNDRTVFAHNGSIPLPRETRPSLGPFESSLRGVNDSEVLFLLMLRHTTELGDPLRGYAAAVADLDRVWRAEGSPKGGPYSGLNVLFARDPTELWAFCLWRGEHGSALLDPRRPYYELAYLADARQVVVGSEPFDTTRSDWTSIPNGHFLHARADRGLVTVESGPIPLPNVPAKVPAPGRPGR